jgi:23S rRNA pseudouridine955/2504/2580 synthase
VGKSEGPAGTQAVLLSLDPATGRTHQLRVHAAHHACPLLGDRTYGGMGKIVLPDGGVLPMERIALHAAWVQLAAAPRVSAPFPAELAALWQALGGGLTHVQSAIDAPHLR